MAKTISPLLSLGAKGTIADSLTFARRRGQTIAQKKPRLPYFLTLPSQYQRWLYQDYAHLWTLQDTATRKSCRSQGSFRHLTGFQFWMSYQLTYLPDIMSWWKLDERTGNLVDDFSPSPSDLTAFGAVPYAGKIDYARWFDGINDYCSGAANFKLTFAMSFECIVNPWSYPTPADENTILALHDAGQLAARLAVIEGLPDIAWVWAYDTLGAGHGVTSSAAVPLNEPTHIVANLSNTIAQLFFNGVDVTAFSGPLGANPLRDFTTAKLGRTRLVQYHWHGLIDNVIIRNRTLALSEAQLKSERRWTPK